MGEANFVQTSFLGGEWSQVMQGRIDRPDYKTAMNRSYNGLFTEEGSWTKRPGTIYGAHTRGGNPARAIAFSFQESTPYTMEFTDSHLRFLAGTNLVFTGTVAVTSISTANPAVVQTGTAHGWVTGDQVVFPAMATADPFLMNRQFVITVVDTTHFSLADPLTGAGIDGSLLIATGATVARILDFATPYGGSVLSSLRVVQSEKKGIILQNGIAPQVLATTVDPSSTGPATFTLTPAQFVDGPYLDPIVGLLVTPAALTGSVGISFSYQTYSATKVYNDGDYVTSSAVAYRSLVNLNLNQTPASSPNSWVAVGNGAAINGGLGLLNTDIGRHVRIFSEPPDWVAATAYSTGNQVKYNLVYWTALASSTGSIPGQDVTKWSVNAVAARWSWGKITSISGSVVSMISRTAGTAIGDMVNEGGLAAGFDGITAQANGACATRGAPGFGIPNAYIGKNFSAAPTVIAYGTFYTSTDLGLMLNPAQQCIVNLRASQTAPTKGSDGTLLGSSGTISNLIGGSVQIQSNDPTTVWNYVWFEFIDVTDASTIFLVAEAQFFSVAATAGSGMTIQLLGPDLLYTTAASIWRLGLFNDRDGYPACGTFHEGRIWLSGMVSNRLDAGVPDQTLFNFAPTEQDGTVDDSSAISYTLDGPDVNAVFWLKPDLQGIIVGTLAGEWLVQASALNSPLSAINMQAHRVTTIGCANIEPRQTEHTTVFVQKHKAKVMEYFADVFSGKFSAPNLSLTAKHLSSRGLEEIAYQQEKSPTIWARCTDQSLIGCAYKRDSLMSSQGPSYAGWHQHVLGSGRKIESMCAGPSTNGLLDTLAMVTNDLGTNIRNIEFFTPIFDEETAAVDAWFVDSGIVPVVAQNVVIGGVSSMKLIGLWPLNGKLVSVFAGGLDCGDFQVTNGVVSVPYSNGVDNLFTAAFAATVGAKVVVGFTYTAEGQMVRPDTQAMGGTRSGPAFGRNRRVSEFAGLFVQSQGLTIGTDLTDADNMKPILFGDAAETTLLQNQLFSGVHWATLDCDSGRNVGMIAWRSTRPYPATIAAMSGVVQTQG